MNAVLEYISLANRWSDAMDRGESEIANGIYDQIQEVHERISHTECEAQWLSQAANSTDAVRFFLASHIKPRDPYLAREIYESLLSSTLPFVAISCKHILREWCLDER